MIISVMVDFPWLSNWLFNDGILTACPTYFYSLPPVRFFNCCVNFSTMHCIIQLFIQDHCYITRSLTSSQSKFSFRKRSRMIPMMNVKREWNSFIPDLRSMWSGIIFLLDLWGQYFLETLSIELSRLSVRWKYFSLVTTAEYSGRFSSRSSTLKGHSNPFHVIFSLDRVQICLRHSRYQPNLKILGYFCTPSCNISENIGHSVLRS